MANTIEPGSSLAQLIPTLDLSQVPAKLHCPACHGFLVNAYKTSCCEQTICEPCYQNLPDHCPSCKHKPFSQDLCRMVKGPRGTAKAYLKSLEKSRMENRDSAKVADAPAADEQAPGRVEEATETLEALDTTEDDRTDQPALQIDEFGIEESIIAEVQPSIEEGTPIQDAPVEAVVSPGPDDEQSRRQASESTDANDDEVEIQVEPSQEDEQYGQTNQYNDEEDQSYGNHGNGESSEKQEDSKDLSDGTNLNGYSMSNTGMGFNNMEMNPMAMMQQMMMNGINPMMGMPMGMNAGMFGGLTGQNGGLNGMNMGMMNFNPNQNMFGWNGQNNNSWQNNNPNAFSNGMGGDFGSQFGFDVSQQGNFQQQQFRNGDFQNNYSGYRGRGRGRGRGGYGRGRGHFNQYSHNNYQGYQNAHEQQQNEIQHMQAQIMNSQEANSRGSQDNTNGREETRNQNNEDFAPGGQEEVNEALEDEKEVPNLKEETISQAAPVRDADTDEAREEHQDDQPQESIVANDDPQTIQEDSRSADKPIPEAYHEDFDSMAPPSAPMGPSGRYGDRDFGFRSRGHGRFASRGRGSFPIQNGHAASPIRSVSQTSIPTHSPPAKGVGVQGAPTGPRAMREPSAPKPASRATGGFQIMGRATMQSQTPQPRGDDRARSQSPVVDHDNYEDDRSRRTSRHERHDSRYENGSDAGHDRDDRDRKRKKSRRDEYDDHDMNDADQGHSRSESQDRKTSHRSSRYEKEKDRDKERYSSKHKSSRRYHDEELDGDQDMDGYGDRAESRSSKHRSSHKSSAKTSSKYDDRPKEKEKEDRHRKRSRHDRDRDEEYDEPNEEESRHRSRRHKKDHHSSSKRDRERDNEREVDDDVGLRINGRSGGRNSSAAAIPTPTSATTPAIIDKDPHTIEREARNRERMAKEAQRREKAAQGNSTNQKHGRGTVSGGRRVSYKYEDEVERGMDERDSARWR